MRIDYIIKILEANKFQVTEYEKEYELESFTDAGVNMIFYISKEEDFIELFKDKVENFDIDEEIEVHRQDDNYKNNFTIRESLEDFEAYEIKLKFTLSLLQNPSSLHRIPRSKDLYDKLCFMLGDYEDLESEVEVDVKDFYNLLVEIQNNWGIINNNI